MKINFNGKKHFVFSAVLLGRMSGRRTAIQVFQSVSALLCKVVRKMKKTKKMQADSQQSVS